MWTYPPDEENSPRTADSTHLLTYTPFLCVSGAARPVCPRAVPAVVRQRGQAGGSSTCGGVARLPGLIAPLGPASCLCVGAGVRAG